ncbi:MAG: hypothetical protein IPK00_25005 [Deltaproteobacteria bacterium]|nr:hypothetical protein [Deltaproteobacteria bacterium]
MGRGLPLLHGTTGTDFGPSPSCIRIRLSRFPATGLAIAGLVIAGLVTLAPRVDGHPSALAQVEMLSAEIRARPDDPVAYIRRGQAYSEEGHFAEALADFEKAEGLGDSVSVAYDLGVVHYRMGALIEARRDFDRWLERHPDHGPALQYRARVLRDSGERDAAFADYRAYLDRHPNPNPGDYLAAAELLAEDGEGDVEGALAMLDAGMRRLGLAPQLQKRAIALERGRGEVDAALNRLDALAPSLGATPDWQIDRAELLLLLGRRKEATAALDRAAEALVGKRSTAARRTLHDRIEALRVSVEAETIPRTGARMDPVRRDEERVD